MGQAFSTFIVMFCGASLGIGIGYLCIFKPSFVANFISKSFYFFKSNTVSPKKYASAIRPIFIRIAGLIFGLFGAIILFYIIFIIRVLYRMINM